MVACFPAPFPPNKKGFSKRLQLASGQVGGQELRGQVLASRAALLQGQTAAPGARRSTKISRNNCPQHPKHQPRCEAGRRASRRGKGRAPQGKHGLSPNEASPNRDRARGASAASRRQEQAGFAQPKSPAGSAGFSRRQKFAGAPGSAARGSQGAAHKGDASLPARGFLRAQQQRGQHEPRVSPRGLSRLQGLN